MITSPRGKAGEIFNEVLLAGSETGTKGPIQCTGKHKYGMEMFKT